jgi:glutamyl-tRNA synthetase
MAVTQESALADAFESRPYGAPRTGGVRFAPSPTGHFHLGNLRTAWISAQLAEATGLPWVVRFEDIDKPRVQSWARTSQFNDMLSLGLAPDFEILQSDFEERHWYLFTRAVASGQVYPCDCSRREVQLAIASAPHDGIAPFYSGRCRGLPRDRAFAASETLAWRFRGARADGADDFIVARSGMTLVDGLPSRASFVPAYHWACAIDDYDGGYAWLVRSVDLLPAAVSQRAIHSWLCTLEGVRPAARILHTSLVVDNSGHRLEKRTAGVTLAEIVASGVSSDELLLRFERSFRFPETAGRGDLSEGLAELPLRDLGFV